MRKLLIFSCAMAAACLCSLVLPRRLPLVLGFFFLVIYALTWLIPKRPAQLLWLSFGLCFGFLYFALYAAVFYLPSQALDGKTVRLEATVTQYPSPTDYGVSVAVAGSEAGGRKFPMRLYLDAAYENLRPGDSIKAVAHLQSTGIIAGRESKSLTAKRVFLSAKLYGKIEHTRPDKIPLRYLPAALGYVMRQGISVLYDDTTAPLMTALLTGYQGDLSDGERAAFSRSGLAHVVAVSGMHISFLAGLMSFLMPRRSKFGICLQIALIFFFAAMTGNGAGALRAAFLCSTMLLAPLLGRQGDAPTSLFAALFLLLLANPYAIAGAGLQFSFAATLGIYLVGQPLYAKLRERIPRKWRRLCAAPLSIVCISLGAMLLTTPLTALYFGQVSLIAPLCNLLTSAAIAFSFVLGLVSLLAFWIFAPLGMLLANIASLVLRYFLFCAEAASKLPFAALPVQSVYYEAFFVFLYAIAIFWLISYRHMRVRPIFPLCAATCGLCCAVLLTNARLVAQPLGVSVLDVGQGQSLVLTSGSYRALVDCGGSTSPGHSAARYLQGQGYRSLDLLILTHYHDDHANGLSALLSRIKLRRLVLPESDFDAEERRAVEALAQQYAIPISYISQETQIAFGAASLRLFPPLAHASDNEAGLALLASLGTWDVLVTGDMGIDGEARLLQQYSLPDIELLVLGHHGSRYASSQLLLDTLKPELAVTSVGRANRYGHPAPETLARLAAANCTLYRSDEHGSIQIFAPSTAYESED